MNNQSETVNVLISGAAGGFGSALALACARRGAQLLLVDNRLKPLEALCDQIEALGAPAPAYCQLDLASAGPDALAELLDGFIDAYGNLSVLAHCAARFEGLKPLDQVSPQDWLMDMQVNVNAPWLLSVTCLPSLRQNNGCILFTLDGHAAAGHAYWGSYGSAKAALSNLVQTFTEELEGTNCKVLGFDPGPMRTDLRAAAYIAEDPATVPHPEQAAEKAAEVLFKQT